MEGSAAAEQRHGGKSRRRSVVPRWGQPAAGLSRYYERETVSSLKPEACPQGTCHPGATVLHALRRLRDVPPKPSLNQCVSVFISGLGIEGEQPNSRRLKPVLRTGYTVDAYRPSNEFSTAASEQKRWDVANKNHYPDIQS